MRKQLKFALWPALVVIALVGVLSIFYTGPKYTGKTWFETEDFNWQLESIYEDVSVNVLNRIDPEEAKEKLIVTQQEIDDYRFQYGTLAEQLDNIERQYRTRIAEAKENKNETLLLALVKERDNKLEDIQENFNNDEYVERKIRKEKERQLTGYLELQKENYSRGFAVAYDFVDTETGERFTKGDVSDPAAFKKVYNEVNGYFRADSLPDGANYNTQTMEYASDDHIVLSEENLQQVKNPVRKLSGTLIISKAALAGGELQQRVHDFNLQKILLYSFWILTVLAIIALLTVVKFKKDWVIGTKEAVKYSRLKIDLRIVLLLLSAAILFVYLQSVAFNLPHELYPYSLGRYASNIMIFTIFGYLPAGFTAFQFVSLTETLKQSRDVEALMKDSYAAGLLRNVNELFSNRTIGVQLFSLLIIFFLAGIGFVGMFFAPELAVIYAFCVVFVALPALFLFVRRGAYLNRILSATDAMAAGHLTQEIPVKGKSPLAKHARNLNNLRDGVRISTNEQAKSERLKTELITNVSHDLRTPLTSIITYTDLLKDETLSAEERAKYVAVLDQKSQRLKTLIEDLFEVSKMASGNLELVKQHVDLNQLMQQAFAEHAEDFSDANLDVRISLPEVPVYALVDGQKLWRVLDNLLINALKYSLPGTRVYVSLQKTANQARFTMKNIAKYEIGGNTDELFERFKRGDESRQTEGSGLGLAIAQSIVELHGGRMDVEVDGDLFKVTIDIAVG
ncbi:sensor histidine kinase [Sporosarcina cascadiensis]|uniref:sensor histidine kinase n=1 Tax=Sporosarcina cascadiensis TaxID=2660747 RepID=UPI00129AAD77|nr:histidine kinase dimerization/phospho-acceptor domain-containing protein [Sporosarcina cascadiensis]